MQMKTLTLNYVWTECITQWRWIVEQLNLGTSDSVPSLKIIWLEDNGYEKVSHNCFLCEYSNQQKKTNFTALCKNCPAILIDEDLSFLWCQFPAYDWATQPVAFLKRLEIAYSLYLKDNK